MCNDLSPVEKEKGTEREGEREEEQTRRKRKGHGRWRPRVVGLGIVCVGKVDKKYQAMASC